MSSVIYTIYGFAIFFFIFWCGKWLLHVLAICYGKIKLHRKVKTTVGKISDQENLKQKTEQQGKNEQQQKQQPLTSSSPTSATNNFKSSQLQELVIKQLPTSLPSISILKPLMGVDPNLHQNLETFFTMNYETYELLFCIENKFDPAISLVESLMQKYPTIDSKLFIGGSNVGVNPKINNMNAGYEAAKYELIMISDSGIRMKEDTLLDMVEYMTSKVGLVHQMPFTSDREGFAATFEKIYFGTVQSRIYLSADLLGINCHTGMSCIMRKKVLDGLGGLQAFGCYLAEDFFIAQAFIDDGWKLAISSQPAWQNSGICDISTFQARLTRWAKLRVAMVPTVILLEPMSECMILGALASWSVSVLFHWDALVFYLVHILMWLLSDWLMLSIVQNGTLPFNKFEFVVGWLLREWTGPYLFLNALWDPAIRWRERIFRLAWGGIAYEITNENGDKTECAINSNELFHKSNKTTKPLMYDSSSVIGSVSQVAKSAASSSKVTNIETITNMGSTIDYISTNSLGKLTDNKMSSLNDDLASSATSQYSNTCITISVGP